jgi:hypothetical protein
MRYEIDDSEYPLRVSCYILPSFDEQTAEIDIPITEDKRIRVAGVPEDRLLRIGMPRLSKDIPDNAKVLFEKGIGIGIAACRLLRQEDDRVTLEIPTVPDPTVVTVSIERLARER